MCVLGFSVFSVNFILFVHCSGCVTLYLLLESQSRMFYGLLQTRYYQIQSSKTVCPSFVCDCAFLFSLSFSLASRWLCFLCLCKTSRLSSSSSCSSLSLLLLVPCVLCRPVSLLNANFNCSCFKSFGFDISRSSLDEVLLRSLFSLPAKRCAVLGDNTLFLS